jgi:predicted regulator of Ras-like GTPase activity (Roadblock/LC7/MglB family)
MDAAQAIADLTEISSQIRDVVVFDADGGVLGSTFADPTRAASLAGRGVDLLAAAERAAPAGSDLSQVEVALLEASVFVVRHEGLRALALTAAEPTSGLVFYDLKTCLRAILPQPKPARKPRRKSGGKPDGAAA